MHNIAQNIIIIIILEHGFERKYLRMQRLLDVDIFYIEGAIKKKNTFSLDSSFATMDLWMKFYTPDINSILKKQALTYWFCT